MSPAHKTVTTRWRGVATNLSYLGRSPLPEKGVRDGLWLCDGEDYVTSTGSGQHPASRGA